MAEWGGRIRNRATGSTQIDTKFYNLALSQKFTQAATAGATGEAPKIVFTIASADFPLVAFNSANPLALLRIDRSGSNWTFTYFAMTVGQAATFYVFGRPTVIAAGGWGLRIKGPAGVIVDSRHRYTSVVHRQAASTSAPPTINLAGGKTYAVVQSQHAGSYYVSQEEVGVGTGQWQEVIQRDALGFRVAGASIVGAMFEFFGSVRNIPNPGTPLLIEREWPTCNVRVLDVTNF